MPVFSAIQRTEADSFSFSSSSPFSSLPAASFERSASACPGFPSAVLASGLLSGAACADSVLAAWIDGFASKNSGNEQKASKRIKRKEVFTAHRLQGRRFQRA